MAKMYPEKFPDHLTRDRGRSAELKTFEALQNLPETYTVFYNCYWQLMDGLHDPSEGENDFIIAHPKKGVIVLEVKGGGITYSAETKTWSSVDRDGVSHPIKDPVDQGRRIGRKLEEAVKKTPGISDKLKVWNAVCFPDLHVENNFNFGANLYRDRVLDRRDLENITDSVEKIFKILGKSLSQDRDVFTNIRILESLFAQSFTINNPLASQLDEEEQQLIKLTDNQFMLFSYLGNRNRVAIAGCAGSGKTMLGLLRAQQLVKQGQSVLFLCYNKPLAEFLEPRLSGGKVSTFHGLCEEATKNMGIRIDRSITDKQLFYEIYPNYLIDYVTKHKKNFDTIIVDEAQDFQDSYWLAISYLLRDDSYFYIFYDDNQNIFNGDTTFQGLISERPFSLPENCRNTKLIHNTVKKFHANPNEIMSRAPDGREPKWNNYYSNEELLIRLKKELNRLVNENHVKPEDVVILTPKSQDKSILRECLKLGNFALTWSIPNRGIQVTTIQRFKGLEKLVVLIAELDRMSDDIEKLLYVGTSRARTELTCFYSDDIESFVTRKGL